MILGLLFFEVHGGSGLLCKQGKLQRGAREEQLGPFGAVIAVTEMHQKSCCAGSLLTVSNISCPEARDLGLPSCVGISRE